MTNKIGWTSTIDGKEFGGYVNLEGWNGNVSDPVYQKVVDLLDIHMNKTLTHYFISDDKEKIGDGVRNMGTVVVRES